MGLGDAGNYNSSNSGNGQRRGLYEQTYYSRTRFKNNDSGLQLGFQYRSGMLVVDISKAKTGGDFGYDSVASIFITHTKAHILLNRIEEFEKYIADGGKDPEVGFCINAGMGEKVTVLILHVTKDGGRAILIGKIDGEGNMSDSADFEFKKDWQYAIKYNNISSKKFEREFLDDIEWNEFCETIQEFAKASNGAIGYTVADITRFDTQRILNKMNPIYEKLGIETGFNRNNNYGSNKNNFFSNMDNGGNQGTSNHKSMDDVMEGFPED